MVAGIERDRYLASSWWVHMNHHGFGLINTLLEIIQILICLLFLKSLLNISSFFI